MGRPGKNFLSFLAGNKNKIIWDIKKVKVYFTYEV